MTLRRHMAMDDGHTQKSQSRLSSPVPFTHRDPVSKIPSQKQSLKVHRKISQINITFNFREPRFDRYFNKVDTYFFVLRLPNFLLVTSAGAAEFSLIVCQTSAAAAASSIQALP